MSVIRRSGKVRIRALTVHQPMAGAIAAGVKVHENRPRNLFAAGRLPEWIALHTGQGVWPTADQELRKLWPAYPGQHNMIRGALLGIMFIDYMEEYPVDTLTVSKRGQLMLGDPWASGRWVAHIAAYRPLPEPIEHRGYQGVWPVRKSQIADHLCALLPEGGRHAL